MKNKSKNKDIFVGDISFDAGEEDLRKLFSVCGTVRSINLLTDPRSGKFSGRAFVRMSTDAEAKEAVNMLDGTLLINRCIRVSAARDKPVAAPVVETMAKKPRRRPPVKRRKRE